MSGGLPAISGPKLIGVLEADGWHICGRSTHGITLKKVVGGELRVTTIPIKARSLPSGTLAAILGSRQTGLGRAGLLRLLS
jgi:predicted RNA binding protein YcfA (HicA-like mRNA interferase family)